MRIETTPLASPPPLAGEGQGGGRHKDSRAFPLASPPPQAGKGADRVCGTTSLRLNAALSPHPGGEELFETHRLALARGFARFDPSETARLDEPLPSRRKLPSAFHRLARIPTHRLVLD